MSEGSVAYSLRVKIRIDNTDMDKAVRSTIRLGNTARGAAKSVESIERLYAKLVPLVEQTTTAATNGFGAMKSNATGVASGLREARKEANWLDDAIKKVAASSTNWGKINAKITGGRRSAFDLPTPQKGGQRGGGAGNFGSGAYIFGGGMASTLGGLAGGFLGGPVGSAVGSMLGGGLGMAGSAGGGAVSGALGYMVELGQQAEVTRAGISSLYMSIEHLDARAASQMARGTFRALSNDAARGVGQISDYTTAYTSMYAPVRQSGGSEDNIRELTKLSLATGYALRGREGLWQAPLDVTQALTGNIGDRTTPIALAALRASGVNADQYRAAKPDEQLKMLLEGFRAFTPAIKAMGETFDAQSETLADKMRQFTRQLSEPFFDGLRRGIMGFNKGMDVIDPQVQTFAASLAIMSNALGLAAESAADAAAEFVKGATDRRATYSWGVTGGGASKLGEQFGMTGGSGGFRGVGSGVSFWSSRLLDTMDRTGATVALAATDFSRGAYDTLSSIATTGALPVVGDNERAATRRKFANIWDYSVPVDENGFLPWDKPTPQTDEQKRRDEIADLLKELVTRTGKPVRIKIDDFRIEWGTDRQMADQMRDLTAHVIERTLLAATESSMLAGFG